MSQYKSKSITIFLFALCCILTNNYFLYVLCLLAPLFAISRPLLFYAIGIAGIWIQDIKQIKMIKVFFTAMIILVYFLYKNKQNIEQVPLSKQAIKNRQIYFIFLYLIGFSILTLGQSTVYQNCTLFIFFILLLAFQLGMYSQLRIGVLIINFVILIWGLITFGCGKLFQAQQQKQEYQTYSQYCQNIPSQSWYFYLATIYVCWVGKMYFQIKQIKTKKKQQHEEIQMQQLPKFTSNSIQPEMCQQSDNQLSMRKSDQNRLQYSVQSNIRQNIRSNQQQLLKPSNRQIKSRLLAHSSHSAYRIKKSQQKSEQEYFPQNFSAQSQLTNIFLLLPFTLFHLKELELPIYLYILVLQYNKTSPYAFYLMFISVCLITFMTHPSTIFQLILRICLIFIVNKNFQLAISVTKFVKTVWLRSSFVIVLGVFFWFSLLTVNIFHICFVVTVLLFITKDSGDNEQFSFRHRNWIYLMILFDVFLVLRLLYSIILEYDIQLPNIMNQVTALMGISYQYDTNLSHFNLIPLIISGIITTQYWTYTSRIYNIQKRKDQSLSQPIYILWFHRILKVLKICYYKLIPWLSHFIVLGILLHLQFSFITVIVSLWSISLLWSHMTMKNQLQAYKTLYWRWMMLLRLLAFEIILRYLFELLKFPFIYSQIGKLPFIEYLIQYQQILGLAIREGSTSYLKNIFTKFQIMIGLDFVFIAISFLAVEYYHILIKYEQYSSNNEIQNSLQAEQYISISSIYHNYINFKLTQWLKSYNDLMLKFSKIFIKMYYFILITYTCVFYSYASFFYFLIGILYYLAINRWYYKKDVMDGKQIKVGAIFKFWREYHCVGENEDRNTFVGNQQQQEMQEQKSLNQQKQNIQESQNYCNDKKQAINLKNIKQNVSELYKKIKAVNNRQFQQIMLEYHQNLRPFIILFTMLFILLTYSSKIFRTLQIQQFLTNQQILYYRYVFYIAGTSYETLVGIIPYLLIIILTVLQIKCCGLLDKNIDEENYSINSDSKQEVYKERKQRSPFRKLTEDLSASAYFTDKKQQNRKKQQGRPNTFDENYYRQQKDEQVFVEAQILQQNIKQRKNRDKKFIDMDISLRLGLNKMLERIFVILLVFVSILQDQNPFSIIYLCLAWLLNYLGNNSIRGLAYTLSGLVILQYTLIITDMENPYLHICIPFPQFCANNNSWLIQVLSITDKQWISYLSYGYTISQFTVLYLSVLILVCYQFVFWIEQYNWIHILERIYRNSQQISQVKEQLYHHLIGIYEYALVYSPICITVLCLGLYFIDFTATNMFLGVLSILFVYKSFLFENYTNSRRFWKSYFRILQLMIIIFMVIYCVLTTPMYSKYCNKILCSQQQFRTKVTKTILLLMLQIGIDLISSHHFITSMNKLKNTLDSTSSYYKLAISYVQNDRKILREFKSINKKKAVKNSIEVVKQFLDKLKDNSAQKYKNLQQDLGHNQSWLDTFLQLLPSLIDSQLIKSPANARHMILQQNSKYMAWIQNKKGNKISEQQLIRINKYYQKQFEISEQPNSRNYLQNENKNTNRLEDQIALRQKINEIVNFSEDISRNKSLMREQSLGDRMMNNSKFMRYDEEESSYRKSYIQQFVPFQQVQVSNSMFRQSLQKSQKSMKFEINKQQPHQSRQSRNSHKDLNPQQKKKRLYLLIFQSVISNWHYLTYFLMVLEFIYNMGIFTVIFPLLTFCYGMISTYQASKYVWSIAFLSLILPIFIKYSISIGLISLSSEIVYLIIGSHPSSIILQYILLFFIIVQCSILKVVGLYDQTAPQVQCMKMALIRNIINVNNQHMAKQRQSMFMLLQKCSQSSNNSLEYIFSKKQCKRGYDYSTLMVSVQITILIYIFCFYEKMAIQEDLTFYKMIQYNQFSTGMVIMAFVQLGFILLQRILNVVEFSDSYLWDFTLICKYILLLISMGFIHFLILIFFPINSGNYELNTYVVIFYILNSFYFLISALQIKYGVDKQSRGFMDRYTWYNGFIYMFYRAIPFLFQFKIFSDWTFTNTSLRLFDWIKFEEIVGFLYVAKCNSLFMRGKILGSKIQWWKKLLMGFPLLLAIILLLFGPLVLFSSLNPLATFNQVSGGYFELSLRINKTNQYPLYINTHITDIKFLNETDIKNDNQLKKIIKSYQIDIKSIQQIHLELYSDQYWEISEGSYERLIEEPIDSVYQLSMRVKFERNYTGTTPIYLLNTYRIPQQQVSKFKQTLQGKQTFQIDDFFPQFIRLDNNNGIHYLSEQDNQSQLPLKFHAQIGKKTQKKYWVINNGITFKITSDKYSKAIFGYSVMSFYISIILVVANYFRFLFQGSAYNIILSDIPYPDPILSICDGVYQARSRNDIYEEQILFWSLIDIMRSPDTIKALAGDYLDARLETLKKKQK